ncbi:MAG: proline--tRNA ligase [Candidatus Aenigmatarchaeota archaeon]
MEKKEIKEQEKEAHQMGMTVRKAANFTEWYYEVVQKADVVDTRFGVKGFTVFMPTAMLVMDEMFKMLEGALQAAGHQPLHFPVVIPETEFKKESSHIKGFEEEVFWITHAGKNKLEERLVLRPTSETAMYPMYSLWVRSHQQLPMKFYQKGSVYRYETKMTKPLLRSREFIWLEAHDVQKTKEDSIKQVEEDMAIFREVVTDGLCVPTLLLKRMEWDKFPGADSTYAFEAVMPDGNVLQIGTTHDLGQKFAKVFGIQFLDENGKKQYAYQTCFGPGISRILGAMIGIHGDDRGLILPPAVAPIQAVIVPIFTKESKAAVFAKCGEVLGWLSEKDFRVHFDSREQYTPGFKFHEWELKGVPVRIEVGPRDIEDGTISLVRRDFLERTVIPEEKLAEQLMETMDSITFQLHKRANEMMLIQGADDYKTLKERLKAGGFVRMPFCLQEACDEKLKADTGAEVRGTLFGDVSKPSAGAKCAICGKPAKATVYAAKAY